MNQSFFIYGIRFIIFSIFLCLTAVIFCYFVDPYSIYGRLYTHNGVKVNAPGFAYQVRMGKAIAIKQRKPDTLIMGSSRSFVGTPSQVAETYFKNRNIYNASVPSVSSYELLRYFQHAVALGPVKQAFIGLDFYQFHGGRPTQKTFSEERLAVNINSEATDNATYDLLSTLFSGDAVFYSLKVSAGLARWIDISLPNGFISQNYEGGSNESIKSEAGYINTTYTIPTFTFATNDNLTSTFEYFRKIVQLAYENHIDLRFYISPSHARQWEVIAQLDLWDKWEFWKREMLHILEQESRVYKQVAFPIYDFSGYNKYSTETVPREEGEIMRWYSDSSHYKQELGMIIFDEMINGSGMDGFGSILKTESIDIHLQSIRDGRAQYIQHHKQDIADIKKLIDVRNKY